MMNTAGEGGESARNNRYPFTASQWQELEHQALVYKYIISVGWKCFEMGFGGKIDPEPGRCRRTDGKKWRCSKEAYPDSKYCERHMHRGRNRSRKPVEVNTSTPTPTPMIPSSKSPNYPSPNSHPLSSSSSTHYNNHITHVSSYSRPSSNVLDSSPYSECIITRKSYGMKEEMDEHSLFSESCGTIETSKQGTFSEHHQNEYPYQQQQQQDEGEDQLALKIDRKDEPQKVMHHFFDEWPPTNNKDSSTTQLSISIPTTARHFF